MRGKKGFHPRVFAVGSWLPGPREDLRHKREEGQKLRFWLGRQTSKRSLKPGAGESWDLESTLVTLTFTLTSCEVLSKFPPVSEHQSVHLAY